VPRVRDAEGGAVFQAPVPQCSSAAPKAAAGGRSPEQPDRRLLLREAGAAGESGGNAQTILLWILIACTREFE